MCGRSGACVTEGMRGRGHAWRRGGACMTRGHVLQGGMTGCVCGRGMQGDAWSGGVPGPRGLPGLAVARSHGVPDLGGGVGVWSRGGAWWRPPRWLLLRVERILLECILVIQVNTFCMMHCILSKMKPSMMLAKEVLF